MAYGAKHEWSVAKSRGHGSKERENLQRQIVRWSNKGRGKDEDQGENTAKRKKLIGELVEKYGEIGGRQKALEIAKTQAQYRAAMQKAVREGSSYTEAAYRTGARQRWDDRDMSIDEEWYYYH
jgi:phage shock protein A